MAIPETAKLVVGGLVGTPTLLVMVVLNIAMIGVAGWFLHSQETQRRDTLRQLLAIVADCGKAAASDASRAWGTPP